MAARHVVIVAEIAPYDELRRCGFYFGSALARVGRASLGARRQTRQLK
jgi:hypothetical protein